MLLSKTLKPSSKTVSRFHVDLLERRVLLSSQTYLTNFTKTNNIYTSLNEEFPHSSTGVPGSGVGTANASFLFDPAPTAIAAAGYAPDFYVSGSNLINNGIDFTLASDTNGHDFAEIGGGQATTVAANLNDVQTVYALMSAYDGQTFSATFTGADGSTQVFSGVSLPDFNGGSINSPNTIGAGVSDQTIFRVSDVGGGGTGNSTTGDSNTYDLTEVAFTLQSSLSSQELSYITFSSNGYETLLLGVTAATVSTTPSTTYDAAADFSTSTNPNGVWSYGELPTETSAFVPYPQAGALDLAGDVLGWFTAAGNDPPYLGENQATSTDTTGTVSIPPNVLDMHPGPDGEYSDTRFTAPTAGPLNITLTFTGVDVEGTTTDVHLLHNGVSLADGAINGYGDSFSRTLNVDSVAAGDTFDFIVGFGNNSYYNDSTTLSAQITPGVAAAPVKTIGGLDPTFGANGLASHDVGFTSTTGLATDGTQSILVGPIGASPSESFGVTRYNGDGSLDTTFGTGGVSSTSFGSTDDVPTAVHVLADGDILVAGTATTYVNGAISGSDFAIAEFTAAGALDPSFGTSGQVLISFSGVAGALSNDVLKTLTVGSSGTIYLGGSSDAAGKGNTDLAVAALSATGAVDNAFGTGGKMTVDVAGGDDVINSLALQTNGEIVAAGSATVNGTVEVALARFLANGNLDPHFGIKGLVTDNVGSLFDSASSAVIQPKGGAIVIGGLTASNANSSLSSDFLVQRYLTTGRLDRTFGGTGTVTTSFGQPSAVTQVVLQSNGEVVASGKTSAMLGGTLDVAIARYSTRGTLDTSFNGTGKVEIDLSAGVIASASELHPLDASSLSQEFNAFTASSQGVVAVTTGGEILDAGNSGADTVEAELIAAGVDLVAKLLSSLPVSVLGGLRGTASISITESGTTLATGAVTIQIQFATDAAGDGAVSAKPVGARVSLKQGQAKPYKVQFNYPTGLPTGAYFVLVTVTNGTGLPADLDTVNNTVASASTVQIAPPFIMLGGSGLSASSPFAIGKPVTINLDVTNNGNIAANGKTTLELYLSSDQTIADGTQFAVEPLPVALAADKSKPYHLRVAMPTGLTAGTFQLLAVIDPNNSLGSDDSSDTLVVDMTSVVVS